MSQTVSTDTKAPPVRQLAPFIERKNWRYSQLIREGVKAVFEVEERRGEEWRPRGYEVVKIRVEKGREKFGKWYPAHEVYPAPDRWGETGWSFQHHDMAMQQFRRI